MNKPSFQQKPFSQTYSFFLVLIGSLFFLCNTFWAQSPFRKIENPNEPTKTLSMKLYQAIQNGYVRAMGFNPRGYSSVDLELENLKPFPIEVDIAGSHLLPRGGRCQRLGLGPIISPVSDRVRQESGSAIVSLEAREHRTLTVATCCLDSGKPSPSKETFDGASVALPEVRETVLRWWAAHPNTRQSDVNSAIWQNKDYVIASPDSSAKAMKSVALCSGSYYQLNEGVLLSLTPEGTEKFLGTNILQVIPTPSAVYAMTIEKEGTEPVETPVLWSLSMTGEESWIRVASLSSAEIIHDILLDANQNLILIRASGVQLWDRSKKQTVELFRSANFPFSVHRKNANSLIIAVRTQNTEVWNCREENRSRKAMKTELWELNFARKVGGLLQRISGSEVHAGKAGVFSVSKAGYLTLFLRESFKLVTKEVALREVIAVGPNIVWALNQEHRILAIHPETGKTLFALEIASIESKKFIDIDAETGDLAVQIGDKFYRILAVDGSINELNTLGQAQASAEESTSSESTTIGSIR